MKNYDSTSTVLALIGGLVVFIINLAAVVGGIWFLIDKLF